jgi:hypothetical protein
MRSCTSSSHYRLHGGGGTALLLLLLYGTTQMYKINMDETDRTCAIYEGHEKSIQNFSQKT